MSASPLCSTKCEILDLYHYEPAVTAELNPVLLPELIRVILLYCVSTRKEEEQVKVTKDKEWMDLAYSVLPPPRFIAIALSADLFRGLIFPPSPPGKERSDFARFDESAMVLTAFMVVNEISPLDSPRPLSDAIQKKYDSERHRTVFLRDC